MITVQELEKFQQQFPQIKRYLVGFSGGIDSLACLHRFAQLPLNGELLACHINHQLSPQARTWQQHCEQFCHQYHIEFITSNILLNAQGESLEAQARQYRYQEFAKHLTPETVLITAHHQQDQAETILMRLCRGAGVKGLAGMRVITPFAASIHWRPLLNLAKQDILNYALQHELTWIEDESNGSLAFDRNFFRHEIFPKLHARWPSVVASINRVGDNCQQTDALLVEIGEQDREYCTVTRSNCLSLSKLKQLSYRRRLNCLREWIKQLCELPSQRQLKLIERTLMTAAADRNPRLGFGDYEIRRYQDQCYCGVRQVTRRQQEYAWEEINTPLHLSAEIGTICAQPKEGGIRLPNTGVTIRFRQGGETIAPAGRGVTKSLKKLFQEHHIPPWERAKVPLLYHGDELIAVVGIAVAENYQAKARESAWEISLTPTSSLQDNYHDESKAAKKLPQETMA